MLAPFILHDSFQASFVSFISTAMVSGNGACVMSRHRKMDTAITRTSFKMSSKSLTFRQELFNSFLIFGLIIVSSGVSSRCCFVLRVAVDDSVAVSPSSAQSSVWSASGSELLPDSSLVPSEVVEVLSEVPSKVPSESLSLGGTTLLA